MSSQLAEVYGTDKKKIQQNFNNNQEHYIQEKHYFLVVGEELRHLKRKFENFELASNINKLYLWTVKGARMHAKSLGTDEAWETYESLVDDYYDTKEQLDELTLMARKNGFVTFSQFNESRFSIGRTIKTFRDCVPRDLIGVAEDFCDYVGQLDADTRLSRCKSAIKGLQERYNKTGYSEAYRIIADVMHIQHVTRMRSQGQLHRREKERMVKQYE
jgi:hypothetical protein